MALPNTIASKASLELFTAAEFNAELKANMEYVDNQAVVKHGCRIRRGTTLSLPNAAITYVPFDSEVEDTDAYHAVTNTERITIPAGLGGIYSITVHLTVLVFPASTISFGLDRNANEGLCRSAFTVDGVTMTWTGPLVAGDYVRLWLYQAQGSAFTFPIVTSNVATAPYSPCIFCYKVG